jgi:hypothetical protein
MAKQDESHTYSCLMPPAHLRRVHHPHDERIVEARKPVRRLLSRLAATFRR